MRDGFIKIAAATPDLHVADCAYNTSEIVKLAKEAAAKGAKLITFPELCLTGYTCGDLFLQETLLEGALDALNTVCRETAELAAVIVVGLPLRVRGKLYNVAAVVNAGDVLAFVPKTHLPNYSEFYEQRHFVSADTLSGGMEGVDVKNADGETICVPLVTDSIFQCDEQPLFTFGVEICEDLWVPNPPSTTLAQMGAHIIVNLSASDEIIGKAGYRRDLVHTCMQMPVSVSPRRTSFLRVTTSLPRTAHCWPRARCSRRASFTRISTSSALHMSVSA